MNVTDQAANLNFNLGRFGGVATAAVVVVGACALHQVVKAVIQRQVASSEARKSLRYCSVVVISGTSGLAGLLAGGGAAKSLALVALVGLILSTVDYALRKQTPAPRPAAAAVTAKSAAALLPTPVPVAAEPPKLDSPKPSPRPLASTGPIAPPKVDASAAGTESAEQDADPELPVDDDTDYGPPPLPTYYAPPSPPPVFRSEAAEAPLVPEHLRATFAVLNIVGFPDVVEDEEGGEASEYAAEEGLGSEGSTADTESSAASSAVAIASADAADEAKKAAMQQLMGTVAHLGLGDLNDAAVENESAAVDAGAALPPSPKAEVLPPSPKFDRICKEILDTERTFYSQMRQYKERLDYLKDRKSLSEREWEKLSEGLEELLATSAILLDRLEDGPAVAYADEELMNRYFRALSDMTANCAYANQLLITLSDPKLVIKVESQEDSGGTKQVFLHQAAILPVQRGPRHAMLLLEISEAKKEGRFAEFWGQVVAKQVAVNYRLKTAQLDDLTHALGEVAAGQNRKLRIRDFASYITYSVKDRTRFTRKAKPTDSDNGTIEINDSSLVLHNILDFLSGLVKTERVKVLHCIAQLTPTKWWTDTIKDDDQLELKLKALEASLVEDAAK